MIAVGADQATNNAGAMVVVYVKPTIDAFAGWRVPANGTAATLLPLYPLNVL